MINLINGTDDIGFPDLTYGWSKLTGEYLGKLAYEKYGLNISIYRPFSGYGEDQHESYPFPSIMKKSLSSSDSIEIWSDAVRDFVYIDDIIEYVLSTCFHDKKLIINNIGTGRSTSMSQLANLMISILPNCTQKTIKILDDKPKGVYYRVSDSIIDYNWITLEEGILKSYKLNYPS
jgi:GDP-L-fucose synthase